MEEGVSETGLAGELAGLGTAGEATTGLPVGLVFVSSGVAGTPGHLSNQMNIACLYTQRYVVNWWTMS